MLTKVLIKRRFIEGKTREIVSLLNEMRANAMNLTGYISGQTLTKPENPHHFLVISTWQSLNDWLAWKNNASRHHIEKMLEIYQEGPTEYEEYVLGTPFSE
jgi:heme-degrading monooxygenase HmoA